MAEFGRNLGRAFVSISPDVSDFLAELTAKVKVAVSQVHPDVRVGADTKPAETAIVAMLTRFKAVAAEAARLKMDADDKGLQSKLTGAQARAAVLAKQLSELIFKADTSKLDAQIAAETASLARLRQQASDLQLDLDDKQAQARIAVLRKQIQDTRNALKDMKGDINIAAAQAKIAAWKAEIKVLKSDAKDVEIGARTEAFNAAIRASEARIAELRRQAADAGRIDPADLLAFEGKLLGVEDTVDRLREKLTEPVPIALTAELNDLRGRFAGLAAQISHLEIDGDDKVLVAKLAALRLQAVRLAQTLADTDIGGDPVKMAAARKDYADLVVSAEKFRALIAKPVEVAATPQLTALRDQADALLRNLSGIRISADDLDARAKLDGMIARAEVLRRELADATIGGDPVKMAVSTAALSSLTAAMRKLSEETSKTVTIWDRLNEKFRVAGGGGGVVSWLKASIGGVGVWHIILDGLIEALIAVGTAVVALGPAIAVLAEPVQNIGIHLKAVSEVSNALHQNVRPLTGDFMAMSRAMAPRAIELYGGALNLVTGQTGVLAKASEQVINLFDTWMARINIWDKQQRAFGGIIEVGVGFLRQFAQVIGDLGNSLSQLMSKDPGTAHYLMNLITGAAGLFNWFSQLPGPIVRTTLGLHALAVWVPVLTTAFMALVRWTKNQVLELAALAASPWTWAIVGAAAIAYMAYQATHASSAVRDFTGNLEKGLDQVSGSDAIVQISADIGALHDQIARTNPASEMKDWNTLGNTFRSTGYDARATGSAIASSFKDLASGNFVKSLQDSARAIKNLFVPGGGAGIAAANDVKAYKDEIVKLTREQTNLFTVTGSLVGQGFSVAQSFGLMTMAGVKASDSLDIMNAKVSNLITGYKNMSVSGDLLANSVNAVSFAALQQQSKVSDLNKAWDAFTQTIAGGESAFTGFATQTTGLYKSLADGGVKLTDSNGKVSLSTKLAADAADQGTVSMTGLNAASLQARDTFLRSAQAANTQMDSLTLLASAAGQGAQGTDMLQQATKDMVASLLPAAKGSQVMTDQLYALAQRGGYQGANSFKALSTWVSKTQDPMKNLDGIVTTLTTDASDLTTDVKNLSIALGTTLNDAMAKAILQANGGQAAFDDVATNIRKTGISSQDTITSAEALAGEIFSLTGNATDAKNEFITFITKITGSKDAAQKLWDEIKGRLGPTLQTLTGTAATVQGSFEDWAKNGIDLVKDKADTLWQAITSRYGPDLDKLANDHTENARKKFMEWAGPTGMGLTLKQAQALWQYLTTTLQPAIDALHGKNVNILMTGNAQYTIQEAVASGVQRQLPGPRAAAGAFITAGTGPTADDVIARVSRGEYVVRASSVAGYGLEAMNAVNAGTAAIVSHPAAALGGVPGWASRAGGGIIPGYAHGGQVHDQITPGVVPPGQLTWPAITGNLTADSITKFSTDFEKQFTNATLAAMWTGLKKAMAAAGGSGASILKYAESFAGTPYVWGGSTPAGWDCSGFVSFVYNHFGLLAGRQDAAGLQRWGKASPPTPGGMAFYGMPAHHVGFVVDGNTLLSALGRKYGTIYSSLQMGDNSGYGIPPAGFAAAAGAGGGSTPAGKLQELAFSLLAQYGWASQWPQFKALEDAEAGWSMTALNPSGAYGLAQFIHGPSEYFQYGGDPNTALGQLTAMMNYIAQRWKSPAAAWANEQAHHWYQAGGPVGSFRRNLAREQAQETAAFAEVARARNRAGLSRTTYSELATLARRQAAEALAYRGLGGDQLSHQTLRHFLGTVHAEERTARDKGLAKLPGIIRLKQDLNDLARIAGNPPDIPAATPPPPPDAWKVPANLTLRQWWAELRSHQGAATRKYHEMRAAWLGTLAHAPIGSWEHGHRATLYGELATLAKRQAHEQAVYNTIAVHGAGATTKGLRDFRHAIHAEVVTTRDKALRHWPGGHLGKAYGLAWELNALAALAGIALPKGPDTRRAAHVPPAPEMRVYPGEFSFDRGGTLRPGWNLAYNGLGRDEDLVPAGQGGDIHIHVHNAGVIGSRAELDNWLSASMDRIARQGRLTYAFRRSFSAS